MTAQPMAVPAIARVALACAVALIFAAIAGRSPQHADAVNLTLQTFASSLEQPVAIVNAGDGSGRLFIVEQTGDIEVYSASGAYLGTFIDVTSIISTGFERGLLGLAFHPDYEDAGNGKFFIFYTDTSGDLAVARYTVSAGDPNLADAGSAQPVITIPHPGHANHNGGQLAFGPDGFLYVGTGDGGGGGDPDGNGQDEDQLLGKILRLNVDALPYTSPPSNPLFGTVPGRDEIWATGLRNPWKFTFDRLTGDLFIGDVGQDDWEEVDFQPAASTALVNYGWVIMEGGVCYPPPTMGCDQTGLTLPILTYAHGDGCSITGGYRYRGASEFFSGKYFYGDYCSGRIWSAAQSGPSWSSVELLDTSLNVSSFGEDEAGELYVADVGGGAVYRMLDTTDADGDTVPGYLDNCQTIANPLQTNSDPDVRPNGPMIAGDDSTWPNSDVAGDACDIDDDNDGLSDADETGGAGCGGIITDPTLVDHDGDHLTDGWECANGSDPTNPSSKFLGSGAADSEPDRIPDVWEQRGYNASGASTDSDNDGCHDLVEIASVDANKAITIADSLAVARASLAIWPPEPSQDYAMDLDKNGAVSIADRLFVARAALLQDWLPKSCP